jgi:hypothetical protein
MASLEQRSTESSVASQSHEASKRRSHLNTDLLRERPRGDLIIMTSHEARTCRISMRVVDGDGHASLHATHGRSQIDRRRQFITWVRAWRTVHAHVQPVFDGHPIRDFDVVRIAGDRSQRIASRVRSITTEILDRRIGTLSHHQAKAMMARTHCLPLVEHGFSITRPIADPKNHTSL